MANSSIRKVTSSVSTFGFMHKVLHNFSDWEIETCHMTRTERSIYFDMRTLYLKLGKPLTDDLELLTRRLRCTNDEELTALEFLLKDKFRHDKKTKTYRQSEWDLILKNYKFRHKTNNDETQNEHDEMGYEHNDEMQNANAERLKVYRERNKKIISSLNKIGVKANSRMTSKQLLKLCEQHNIALDDEMPNNDETQNEHDEMGYEQKNKSINRAITNNHKPITNINNSLSNAHEENSTQQVFEKASQICDQNAQSIQDWQAPTFQEISDTLKMAGFTGNINQQQYTLAIKDFKDHWAEEALKGNPLLTDSKRKNKLRDWIKNGKEFKPTYSKPKSQPIQYGGADDPMAVNAKWGQDDDYAPTKTADEFWAEFDAKQQAKQTGIREL